MSENLTVRDVLVGARDIIASGRWTKGAWVQSPSGGEVDYFGGNPEHYDLKSMTDIPVGSLIEYDYDGQKYVVVDTNVCKMCAEGAIACAAGDITAGLMPTTDLSRSACNALSNVIGGSTVATWNDNDDLTIEEAVAAFDRAIANLDAKVPA